MSWKKKKDFSELKLISSQNDVWINGNIFAQKRKTYCIEYRQPPNPTYQPYSNRYPPRFLHFFPPMKSLPFHPLISSGWKRHMPSSTLTNQAKQHRSFLSIFHSYTFSLFSWPRPPALTLSDSAFSVILKNLGLYLICPVEFSTRTSLVK